MKRSLTGTWEDLLKSFNEKLDALAKHQYIWIHQVEQCRALKNSLQDHEAVVHMGFSVNYACKLNVEVQSFHYGGIRKQATIRTCMVYKSGMSQAYGTISDSLRHDEGAAWAHLKPVLDDILSDTTITTLHFMSDGPLTQYSNLPRAPCPSFMALTWSHGTFQAHGQGQGAPDGVSVSIKRSAPRRRYPVPPRIVFLPGKLKLDCEIQMDIQR